jgi:acetyl esterase
MAIDPCFADLLSDPRNIVRPPPEHITIDKVRRAADSAVDQGELPELTRIEDGVVHLPGRDIPIRHYRPSPVAVLPAILFCHGGGFVWGSIDTHDGICRRLAAATGAAVISVGYRLAPETRFPGPVEDVYGVLEEFMRNAVVYGINSDAVALCGDSAGGALCVSACVLASRAGKKLRHLGLFYPALDPACESASQHTFADGPLLTRDAMRWFWSCFLGDDSRNNAVSMLHQLQDFSGFPATTIVTAEYDPLRDEGNAFHTLLVANGVPASLTCVPGMIHGFLSLPVESAVVVESFNDVAVRLGHSLECNAYAARSAF